MRPSALVSPFCGELKEDEAMAGEKLRRVRGDASGTKLPSDAGTNQHSNPSAEGRARWSNTKNVSN